MVTHKCPPKWFPWQPKLCDMSTISLLTRILNMVDIGLPLTKQSEIALFRNIFSRLAIVPDLTLTYLGFQLIWPLYLCSDMQWHFTVMSARVINSASNIWGNHTLYPFRERHPVGRQRLKETTLGRIDHSLHGSSQKQKCHPLAHVNIKGDSHKKWCTTSIKQSANNMYHASHIDPRAMLHHYYSTKQIAGPTNTGSVCTSQRSASQVSGFGSSLTTGSYSSSITETCTQSGTFHLYAESWKMKSCR